LGLPHPLNISFWCATLGPTTAVYSCQVCVRCLSPILESMSFRFVLLRNASFLAFACSSRNYCCIIDLKLATGFDA
jgi:hypothetical protein